MFNKLGCATGGIISLFEKRRKIIRRVEASESCGPDRVQISNGTRKALALNVDVHPGVVGLKAMSQEETRTNKRLFHEDKELRNWFGIKNEISVSRRY
jgi:hypothetical protein